MIVNIAIQGFLLNVLQVRSGNQFLQLRVALVSRQFLCSLVLVVQTIRYDVVVSDHTIHEIHAVPGVEKNAERTKAKYCVGQGLCLGIHMCLDEKQRRCCYEER